MTMNNNNNNVGAFGDTTLTKVFVGGLAWETPNEGLRDHFEKYGEILEAVIISDKLTARSKGYGFVTFKEAEDAKKACDDQANLVINGRRANCNLASLGSRRPRSSSNASTPSQPQEESCGGGAMDNTAITPGGNHVQWYYPAGTPASPYHHQPLPYYGYTPTYIPMNMNYYYNYNHNQKLSYSSGGPHINEHHVSNVYRRQAIMGSNTMMQMYPVYQYHHPTVTMGIPSNYYHPTVDVHFAAVPARIMSKPISIIPHTGQLSA